MTIEELEARVRTLEIALASQDAQREPDDWETTDAPDVAMDPPVPAQAAPPAVGTGARGELYGAYALEDHTHDADAAPDPDELLPAPCPDYGGILRSHVTGGTAVWERRCLADDTTLSLAFGNGEVSGVAWEEVEKLEVGFIDETTGWELRAFVVMPEASS